MMVLGESWGGRRIGGIGAVADKATCSYLMVEM